MSYYNNLPAGIKLENTSISHNAKMPTYAKPQIFAQNQNPIAQKGKPRGGWEDDDDVGTLSSVPSMTKSNLVSQTGTASNSKQSLEKQDAVIKQEIQECDQAFLQAHEYETKIINDIVQPNGARVKQPDSVLNEFCRACESLQVEVIGSLLYHNLHNSNIWTSKMKAIYAIEGLVKRMNKYKEFFKYNLLLFKCKTFTEDGPNGPQLKKALEDLTDFLEGNENKKPQTAQKQSIEVQKQSPPTKIDVFNIPSSSATTSTKQMSVTTNNTTVNSPIVKSGGLPGAFKNQAKTTTQPQNAPCISSQEKTQYQNQNQNPNCQNTNQLLNPKKTPSDNILDSLAGLDFSENGPNHASPLNQISNLYSGQYQHGGSNFGQSPTSYPPNQGGQFYPNQFNPGFLHQFPQQIYPQQFPGQYVLSTNNNIPPSNNQMQGAFRCQGQVPSYGGYYNMQHNDFSQQVPQGGEQKNSLSIAEIIEKQEQERQQKEEMEKKKKQQEIESKFDSLKYLL